MRGVMEAVDARTHGRVRITRDTRSHTLVLLAAAVLSLALGLTVKELAGGRSASSPAPAAHGLPARTMVALPPSLSGPVSAALGADNPAYLVTPRAGGRLAARTPAQHLTSSFGTAGVTVHSATASLSLGLRAVGFGSALTAVAPVAPRAHANRVVFSREGLSEWYANGPFGLEQGFTLQRAPVGHHAGPLTLELGLSGSAAPVLAPGHKSFTVGSPGPGSISYRGLSAVDAHGRVLPSRLQISGGHLLIMVDPLGASYPVKIDPFVQQGVALTGGGESGNGRLGASVALSADGNTALVGGWRDSSEAGAAWVFTRTGETWTQQGSKLTGSGELGVGRFGTSVALSDDGNTALIGGWADNSNTGAAWVFTRSGSTWSQQGSKLTGSGETGSGRFGTSVALSDDGNTALIGGPKDNANTGAAWAFTRSGSTWSQQGSKLTGSGEGTEGSFGSSVALSGDGNTALIGAFSDENIGAAYAFVRSGEAWSQQGSKLKGSGEGEEASFGESVALSDDGNTALVGGPGDNSSVGAVWAFTRSGEAWSQQGSKLTASDESGAGRFGETVALSSDGNTAAIGAPHDAGERGAVWPFMRSGGSWGQQSSKLTVGEGAEEELGTGVAISSSATTILAGARFAHAGAGAAYVFQGGTSHAPTVLTLEATSVKPTSAVLNATVNPNGQNVTECVFEYGTSISYGHTAACSPSPGSEELAVAVSASVSGLTSGQLYHFRISATNGSGTSVGADRTFSPEIGIPPTVSKLSIRKGPATGGTFVTITGTGFSEPATVDFGNFAGTSVHVVSATSITVVSPPATSGDAQVTVTTEGGTSALSSKDKFKFENPTVTKVSPEAGPRAGGTVVTVTGSGFALGSSTTILFGKKPGTAVNCPSVNECTATAPKSKKETKPEVVDVVAQVGKSKSRKSRPADAFRYE